MASITSPSDFTNEVNIANRSQQPIAGNIQHYIDTYEPKILKELLGDVLLGQIVPGVPWDALVAKCKPSILRYVYWWYANENSTDTTGSGESKANTANAQLVSPDKKIYDRWNEMVQYNKEVVEFINAHTSDYGEYYNPSYVAYCGTFYGYGECLTRAPWIFELKNRWGI